MLTRRWKVFGGVGLASLVGLLSAGAMFTACGDSVSDGPANECDPGTEVFCKCRGGFDGTKTCLDDGVSFGECTTPEGPCPEIEEATSSGAVQICTPDELVACSCDNGDEGEKTCAPDGLTFGDCTTASGPCGTTTTGDKLLYATCASASECQTGVCDGGYCTRSCENFVECYDEPNELYGECVSFAGKQNCAPFCYAQSDCTGYGATSVCGGAAALDDDSYVFASCADWGEEALGMPYGTACDSESGELLYYGDNVVQMECDIGLAVGNVCAFQVCTEGCYEADDCPAGECSSDGSVIGCCIGEPGCTD